MFNRLESYFNWGLQTAGVLEAKKSGRYSVEEPSLFKRIFLLFLLALPVTGRTNPITALQPLPSLKIGVADTFDLALNMKNYFQHTDPSQNLELSASLPSWLSLNMGPLAQVKTLYLGSDSTLIFVEGNYAYMGVGQGMDIIDISNPSTAQVVGNYQLVGYNPHPIDIIVQGNYAFLTAYTYQDPNNANEFQVIDVSNHSNPTLAASIKFASPSVRYGTVAAQGYVYLTDATTIAPGNYNLVTFDIRTPTKPKLVSQVGGYNPNLGMYIKGNHLYMPEYQGAGTSNPSPDLLRIMNISNPLNPVTITTMGATTCAAEVGNYLYTLNNGFAVYDISKITQPVLLNTLFTNQGIYQLVHAQDYLYASGNNVALVIDIRQPSQPQVVATFPIRVSYDVYTLSNFDVIRVNGNNIYVANNDAGLLVMNAAVRVLSGSPTIQDRGLQLLNVTVRDEIGNTLVEPLVIHVGEISVTPIPNQQVMVGNAALFTLDAATFEYPHAHFTYSAGNLPSCALFDAESRTFLFNPLSGDQNSYTIEVTGDDGYGGVVSTSFNLLVPDRPPVLAAPLANQTAYTGQFFEYVVDPSSFTDGDNDPLTYTANLVGSTALPNWLGFDPVQLRFYGTPFGRNSYQIQINANDGHGGIAMGSFTIAVPNSPPILLNAIGTQLASIGTPYSFTFNSDTFYDVDGDRLTYSTDPLPSFLQFNSANRTFTGLPQAEDGGSYTIKVYAQDPFGSIESASFTLSVIKVSNNLPPVVLRAIADFTVKTHVPFNHTFPPDTFQDPKGLPMTYSATMEGGSPLPQGVYFDADSLALSGMVPLPEDLQITIKASNTNGNYALATFTMTVLDGTSYPPTVLNPLPDAVANVGELFSMTVPKDTFKDVSGEELTLAVTQAGGLPLPAWLKWDSSTLTFSGKPGPLDTNPFTPRVLNIDVWASDSVGSAKSEFIITVQGESLAVQCLKLGLTTLTSLGTLYGLWKKRAYFWNKLYQNEFQKGDEIALVGTPFRRSFQLERLKIKEVRVKQEGKSLPKHEPLPEGLRYRPNLIEGTPASSGNYTFSIIDHEGFINEKFDLIIKEK